MIYAGIVGIIIVAFLVYKDAKNAPEMWTCHYCNNEVTGGEHCPYCGISKEE